MNVKLLIAFLAVVFLVACSKSASDKQSYLSLASISADSVHSGNNLTFNLEFSHPYSGDIHDTLYIRINYKNCSEKKFDTTHFEVPQFTNAAYQTCKLAYIFKFGGGGMFTTGCSNNTNIFKADSARFQFWLIDRNSVSSDTISSKMIFLNQ